MRSVQRPISSERRFAEWTGKTGATSCPEPKCDIVLKKDQRTGKLTRGFVKDLLTRSARHPHGIKVRLTDGQVGRVKEILPATPKTG